MPNPLLERMAKRSAVAHGGKSEKRVALSLGARVHAASGAKVGHKSDMSSASEQIEAKSTIKGSINIERAWLQKITQEALTRNKNPALTISFVTPDGKPVDTNSDWVCIPLWRYKELTGQ